ncbi:MAG: L,D-transpeptidase family protein, partial [Hyphomonas sp.]
MILLPESIRWRAVSRKFFAVLFALALPVLASEAKAQAAASARDSECPAEVSASTDAITAGCAQDAAMLQSLDALSAHGLDPAAYTVGGASARDAWLLAATHLRRGVLDPETLTPRMTADLALAASLDAVPAESNAAAYSTALEALSPTSSLYAALQTELQRQQYGQSTSKDPLVTAAAGTRIAKLLVSLEHLRWLPHETTPRRIYANIPTFEVVAVSGEKEVSRHVAIFGELDRQTPEFSESIEYLEFSPWWYVPASIARDEKLAQFQRDPGEVERLGYRIFNSSGKRVNAAKIDWDAVSASDFPYRIRQAPGPANALGQVKFMFPNSQSIYLHDTPDGGLFAQ